MMNKIRFVLLGIFLIGMLSTIGLAGDNADINVNGVLTSNYGVESLSTKLDWYTLNEPAKVISFNPTSIGSYGVSYLKGMTPGLHQWLWTTGTEMMLVANGEKNRGLANHQGFYAVANKSLNNTVTNYYYLSFANPLMWMYPIPVPQITTVNYDVVKLNWTVPTDQHGSDSGDALLPNIIGYNVYYSTSPTGNFLKANGAVLTTTNFTHTNGTEGSYYYVLELVFRGNKTTRYYSANSALVNVIRYIDTIRPNRVLDLIARTSGSDYLLNWQVVSDNVKTSYYSVYRSSSPSLNNAVKLLDTVDLGYTDRGIVGTGTYYYFVKAVDAANNSSITSNVAYLSAMTLPIIQDGGDTFVWFSLPANTSYRTARDLALALSPTGLKFTAIMDNDYLTQENRPYLYNTIAGWSNSPLDNFNLDPSKGYWLGLNKNVSSVGLNIIGSHSTTRSIEVTSNVGNTSLIMINLPYNHAYNNSIELLNDINTQMGLAGNNRIAGLAEYSVSERLYKWTTLNPISGYQKEDPNSYLNVTGAAIMLNVLKANGNVMALKWIPRVKSY